MNIVGFLAFTTFTYWVAEKIFLLLALMSDFFFFAKFSIAKMKKERTEIREVQQFS